MPKHHSRPLPRLWLMTDERMGEALLPSIRRLPKGAGVVFRHYSLPPTERAALIDKVKRLARARRLMLVLPGKYGGHGRYRGALTAPVHSIPERIAAQRNGARLIFVSPVFPTTSHPGGRALGRLRFGQLIRDSAVPVIALGGMTPKRAKSLAGFGIYGWAAITNLTGEEP